MTSTTVRVLIAIFLIVHGLMHMGLTQVPLPQPGKLHTPFWPTWKHTATDASWPASKLGMPANVVRWLGITIWVIAMALFVLAGLGLLGVPGLNSLWPALTLAGSAASLLMMVFYWHPWYVVAVALNVALLVAVRAEWPAGLFASA